MLYVDMEVNGVPLKVTGKFIIAKDVEALSFASVQFELTCYYLADLLLSSSIVIRALDSCRYLRQETMLKCYPGFRT